MNLIFMEEIIWEEEPKNDNTRRVKGGGTIRKNGNGYEGRITVEVMV